jgi:hypothetical protein
VADTGYSGAQITLAGRRDQVGLRRVNERMPAPSRGLYHLVWVIREPLAFMEPSAAVAWDRFASDLRNGFKSGEAVPAPHK